jgi:nucleotide-binding universal stress UspA family protein
VKTILVPTDFSIYANNALQIAFEIAQKTQAHIILQHIVPSLDTILLAPDALQTETTWEEKHLNQVQISVKEKLKKAIKNNNFPEEQISIRIDIGDVFKCIIQSAKDFEADLIIMGTHGATPLESLFFGSNTEKVTRFSPCPVLAVKQNTTFWQIQKILIATDLSESNQKALKKWLTHKNWLEGDWHYLYVQSTWGIVENKQEQHEKQKIFAQKVGLTPFFTHIIEGNIEAGSILSFAQQQKASLIITTSHQRQGWAYFLLGSISGEIVNQSPQPVLVLPNA